MFSSLTDRVIRWRTLIRRGSLRPLPPDFEPDVYLTLNPDLAAQGVRPKRHYILYGRAEGRPYSRSLLPVRPLRPPDDMLAPARITSVRVDLTTRCNLRCTYCAVSQPDYVGVDMAPGVRESIREQVLRIANEQTVVVVNGHGETTFLPDWHRFVTPLLDARLPVYMLSNLAKELDEAELAALARLKNVCVSIDTFDRELLRTVRRAVTPDRVRRNIERIRETARAAGHPAPSFSISAGLYDKNTPGLMEFAREVVRLGFASVVFWNLVKHPDVEGGVNVLALDALPPTELAPRLDIIDRAVNRLRINGVNVIIAGEFVSALRRRQEESAPPRRTLWARA